MTISTIGLGSTAWLRIKIDDGSYQEIRVICDSGAQSNLLSENAFRKLKIERQSTRTNIIGINGGAAVVRGEVVIEVLHRLSEIVIASGKFIVVRDLHLIHPKSSFTYTPFPNLKESQLADPNFHIQGSIDGVIGAGILAQNMRIGIQRNHAGLLAQNTTFGWIISGENDSFGESDTTNTIGLIAISDINPLIKKLWEIDDLEDKLELSSDDQLCEDNYKRTVVMKNNRYCVVLPLKPDAELGESRATARRRLYCLESRFKKHLDIKESYIKFMNEYEQLGHMRKAGKLDPNLPHYYIPHHAVSIDRKFRVVFDGSAKTTNGKSLNDIQYVGPRLQKDLLDIIMKFRTGQYALTADICKMFRQIEIQSSHWDYQRILWRKDTSELIHEYWLTVVTYGLASSPYNAVKSLIQCALDHSEEYPRAAKVVINDFYMDDMLTSVESKSDAQILMGEVIALLQKGGFELAKWRSNLTSIMKELIDPKLVKEQDSTSVLGIIWNYKNDEFQFKVQSRIQPEIITKRVITSEAARIFDPQGYVGPITVRAKLFIQELWRLGYGWDAPLPTELQQEWRSYYNELQLISEIRIPRWLGTSSVATNQIHLFCDASGKAYDVAAYVRVFVNNQWSAKLLCSKSKVSPLKVVTIPRLELCAVELGCKLLSKIRAIPMLSQSPIFLWTDSEIVLYWLRKSSSDLKTFVANSVIRILQSITVEQSRHIRSEHNPADLVSRGTKSETLLTNPLWWNGPSMLTESNEDWPHWKPNSNMKELSQHIEKEVKIPKTKFDNVLLTIATTSHPEMDLLESMSCHQKACRITAFVLRFCMLCYEPVRKRKGKSLQIFAGCYDEQWQSEDTFIIHQKEGFSDHSRTQELVVPKLTIKEIDNALNYWLKTAQKQSFPNEYKAVSNQKALSKGNQLWTLTPQLDQNDLLRIHGRLANTNLSFNQKQPIILHHKSTLARRLAEQSHKIMLHGGVQLCTQYLRNKYWIIGVRILLRNVVYHCVTCTRYRQETSHQFMADLPVHRLLATPAFHSTGVDYAGPFTIKQSRNVTSKGYIAVFVCKSYKAVHLELVSSLTSESFIAALTRFINLRAGCVQHIYSDNGRNFVGADRELREAVEIWKDHDVMNHLRNYSIQWHFNVPLAPHHGGLWEAAVKSVKHHLKRMGGTHLFTFEELATLLAKISACLNSRPITPMSSDPNDLLTLTPGHFLTGQPIITPYEGYLAECPMNRLSAWQKIQKLQQDFWNRWSAEYVTEQQRRNKWADYHSCIQIGDLVFIKDELTPPSQWMMGRIIETYPGRDNRVRSCKIKTEKSELVRPITKLCLLPMEPELNNDETSEPRFP